MGQKVASLEELPRDRTIRGAPRLLVPPVQRGVREQPDHHEAEVAKSQVRCHYTLATLVITNLTAVLCMAI